MQRLLAIGTILIVAACSANSPTAEPTFAPTPTPTPTQATTPTPTLTPAPTAVSPDSSPVPTPADLSARPLIWYAPLPPMPGRTGSVDFNDQFTPDAPWATAAGHVGVYKLYAEWVDNNASDAQLAAAVQDIARRGLVLAVEDGPLIAPQDCGQDVESFAGEDLGRLTAERVIAAGGRIAVVALDEPYYYGHVYDGSNACHLDLDVIAQEVADYVASLRTYFPELIVGDIEPNPAPVTAAGIGEWLATYERVAGEPFAFLHLDADWGAPGWQDLAHEIQAELVARGVPFGMIYNGGSAPVRDQWIQLAGDRVKTFDGSGDPADHAVFQSWMVQPDHAMPDTDPTTFSGLVLTYATDYEALGTSSGGPGSNLALHAPARASATLPEAPPEAAVDGDFDTSWSSGSGPLQWIEVKLDGVQSVAGVRLTVGQFPAGYTVHRVLGRVPGLGLQLLHEFAGPTADGDVLEFTPPEPWSGLKAIRIETHESPSWVAWREIEVLAP